MTSANSRQTAEVGLRLVKLGAQDDYDGWRDVARRLAAGGVSPEAVVWQVGGGDDLFAADNDAALPDQREVRVPRLFPELARQAILHRDPQRFALLYALLVRLQASPRLLEDQADPLVRKVEGLAKAVRRDMHKMHAFVRFRELDDRFVAWFEPEHHIVRANAGFFARRFASMRWSILTPEVSLHWDGETLTEGPGADRSEAAGEDVLEEIWKAYYASIFNPSRLKVSAMLKEMPKRYWKNLPEAELIAPLIAGAQAREAAMVAAPMAEGSVLTTLAGLRDEAQGCRRCSLYRDATQCVFGEGPPDARLVIVGEQPGDEEDLAGKPFVGPAGRLLDRAMADAGVDRSQVYVTNAVKHFKFVLRGKRRIHQSPNAGEIDACRWWLDQEIGLIKPPATLMLGASAIRGVVGRPGTIAAMRGKPVTLSHGLGIASYHPSYVLRVPDKEAADQAYAALVEDLERAREVAG